MAYSQTFKGSLAYANAHLLEAALDAFVPLDQGFVSFDRIDAKGLTVKVEVDGSAPASMYEESVASVRALAQFAKSGEVQCSFEGDGDQFVEASGRSDVKGLPPRHRRWELRFAAKDGDVKALTRLLSEGVKPLDASSPYFNETLHQVASSGNVEAVRALLKAGVPVDHRSGPKGPTPLCFAKSAEVVAVLIAAGAKPDAKVFVHGIANGDEGVGLAMIAHGVPLPKGTELTQVLADVVERGQVKLLAKHGVPVAPPNGSKTSPLLRAVIQGDEACVKWLLAQGASPSMKDPKGQTAHDMAELFNHEALAKLLKPKIALTLALSPLEGEKGD